MEPFRRERGDVFILLRDKQGEKTGNAVMDVLFGNTSCHVLRGELAVKIPEKHKSGQPSHNHQTVFSDQPATFYDSTDATDLAPLLGNQAGLLAGVKSKEERYKLFITPGKLEWGSSLQINDPVLVSLNHLLPTDTQKATAVIQYVGPVRGENGIMFGVEIEDNHFYGQGTTDGTFQGERYFTCIDGNGVFVAFEKISELPTGVQAPEPPQPQHHGQPTAQEKRSKKSYRFKVDDRVVAFKSNGTAVRGTVRWVGPYTLQNEKKQQFGVASVGIETDEVVGGKEMESCLPAKYHYFIVGKKKSHLFMREEEVILESDFGSQLEQQESKSCKKPPRQSPTPQRSPPSQLPQLKSQGRNYRPLPPRTALPPPVERDPLDIEDTRKFAQQMGAGSHTELMKEKSELQRQLEELQHGLELEQQRSRDLELQLQQEHRRQQQLELQLQQERQRQQQLEGQLQEEQDRSRGLQFHLQWEQDRTRNLQERLDRVEVENQELASATFTRAERSEVVIEGLSPIGEGAWGKVEKGRFRNSQVAIKSIHTAILMQNTVERLKREITIMAQIHHPNLVRFVAAVLDGPAERLQAPALILSELLDTDLRSGYQEQRVLPSHHLGILRDVAYGLHHLHSLQTPIIHRDVSTPNILLRNLPNGGWLAKVSDFGSANFAKLAKTMGEGAIIYSAPETIPATVSDDSETPPQKLTVKVDVFSYGKVVCELVVGKMPVPEKFRGMLNEVERKWALVHGLIVRCTKRSPAERPSMADILNELPCPSPQT